MPFAAYTAAEILNAFQWPDNPQNCPWFLGPTACISIGSAVLRGISVWPTPRQTTLRAASVAIVRVYAMNMRCGLMIPPMCFLNSFHISGCSVKASCSSGVVLAASTLIGLPHAAMQRLSCFDRIVLLQQWLHSRRTRYDGSADGVYADGTLHIAAERGPSTRYVPIPTAWRLDLHKCSKSCLPASRLVRVHLRK